MSNLPEFAKDKDMIDKLFDGIDDNKNGTIDYQEMIRYLCPKKKY